MSLKIDSGLKRAGLKVVKLLRLKGFRAFWVGGVVRDTLLARQSDNLDIATDAIPDEVENVLKQNKIYSKPVGKKFGSILAIIDGFMIEITTFRKEAGYSDKRHPDQVEFIKEYLDDAKRRDFTINALYFDPLKKTLYDPTGGIKDLRLKLLRFVGDPKKRIEEDALRMLRGVRLATQLGFKLEKNSFAAIKTRAKYIQGVSGERKKAELDKILLSTNPVEGLKLLDKTGLLKFIIPETEHIKNFYHKSRLYHLEGSIFDHTLLVLSKVKENDLNLLYALLFHDIGKPQTAKKVLKKEGWVFSTKGHADAGADIFVKFAAKLKFPRQSRQNIEWLIRNHMTMETYAEMKALKQLRLARHPFFRLLLKHWEYDEAGTTRTVYPDEYHRKYIRSLRAGKNIADALSRKQSLINKLATGDLIMKYSGLKPSMEVGRKIEDVIVQIVLGKIKNNKDLKEYLTHPSPGWAWA